MKFIKQRFMDIEMDVLVGHPDHELLFIASQAARAAGLKNPSNSIYQYRKSDPDAPVLLLGEVSINYGGLEEQVSPGTEVSINHGGLPVDPSGRRYQAKTVLMPESATYQMLLRGHAPESEPFRKWVTEEVLPALRKNGSYSLQTTEDSKAIQIGDQLAEFADKVASILEQRMETKLGEMMRLVTAQNLEVREEIRSQAINIAQDVKNELKALSLANPVEAKGSPYEGVSMVHLADRQTFDTKIYHQVGEVLGWSRPVLDKMKEYVLLNMEIAMSRAWASEDGRTLQTYVSEIKRKWNFYPKDWAKSRMDRGFYREVMVHTNNERLAKI